MLTFYRDVKNDLSYNIKMRVKYKSEMYECSLTFYKDAKNKLSHNIKMKVKNKGEMYECSFNDAKPKFFRGQN